MIWREKRTLLFVLGAALLANAIFFFTYRVQYENRLRALDADTSLHLRPHLRVAIDAVGDDLRLSFADRNLTLPSSTGPALDAVLSGAVLAAGSLPGLDEADSLVLARRLLREALVVPAGAARY